MSRLRRYAQLVRLPNLPSALADICLGALAVAALPARWPPFVLLLLATTCLYWAGMVWNDYFDVDQDRKERPFRPIPSGGVSLREASLLGAGLLLAGLALALLAGHALGQVAGGERTLLPGLLALLLGAAVLLYDALLKRTWAGPVAMGACRFLNVLLGVSISGGLAWPVGAHLASVVGLYVVGVTWLARSEAGITTPAQVKGAAAVLLGSFGLALLTPTLVPRGVSSPAFPYLLVLLIFLVGAPVREAVISPTPARVQAAVRRALASLILLDAVLASGVAGSWGLLILLLVPPAGLLRRLPWLYTT